jgi:cation transport ATPase
VKAQTKQQIKRFSLAFVVSMVLVNTMMLLVALILHHFQIELPSAVGAWVGSLALPPAFIYALWPAMQKAKWVAEGRGDR